MATKNEIHTGHYRGPRYTIRIRSAEHSVKVPLNYPQFSGSDVTLDSISGSLIQAFLSGVCDSSRWLKFRPPGHRLWFILGLVNF